jgi:hypothetical protein
MSASQNIAYLPETMVGSGFPSNVIPVYVTASHHHAGRFGLRRNTECTSEVALLAMVVLPSLVRTPFVRTAP